MMKNLLDLWILKKKSGIVIFSKVNNPITDDDCLGGIISALSYFVKGELKETLTNFRTDSFQYNLLIKNKIMFVGRFPRLIEEWYILQELNDIAEKFFIRYPKHIFDNWDYNVSKFIGFNEVLAEP